MFGVRGSCPRGVYIVAVAGADDTRGLGGAYEQGVAKFSKKTAKTGRKCQENFQTIPSFHFMLTPFSTKRVVIPVHG